MSDTRYYAETPCPECGKPFDTHIRKKFHYWRGEKCDGPGGSRVEVKPIQPDYEASARGLNGKVRGYEKSLGDVPSSKVLGHWIFEIVDAALAGGVLVEVDDG